MAGDPVSPGVGLRVRRGRRRASAVAVAGAVLAGAVVVVAMSDGGRERTRGADAAASVPAAPDRSTAAAPSATSTAARPAGTRTADDVAAARVLTVVDHGHPSAGPTPLWTGVTLAALADDGRIVTIDLDGGRRRELAGRAVGSSRMVYLVADGAALAVVTADPADGFRVALDRLDAASVPESGLAGPLLPGPEPGTVWRRAPSDRGEGTVEYELVGIDADGIPGGPRIVLEFGDVLGGDGRGGLLLRTVERVVVAAADGAFELVTDGSVVAAGAGAAWVRECGPKGCRLLRVDRVTGVRVPIELAPDAGVRAASLGGVGRAPVGAMGRTVSPDGDVALVRRSSTSTRWLMVDLAASRVTPVPSPDQGAPVVWSADSRYAVWLSDGAIRVYDRTAAGYADVEGLPPLRTFTEVDDSWSMAGYPQRVADIADQAHGVPAAPAAVRIDEPADHVVEEPAVESVDQAVEEPAVESVDRPPASDPPVAAGVTRAARRARSGVPSGRDGPRGRSARGS